MKRAHAAMHPLDCRPPSSNIHLERSMTSMNPTKIVTRKLLLGSSSLRALLAAAAIAVGVGAASSAHAQSRVTVDPGAAQVQVRLAPDFNSPRGITTDPRSGDLFIGTFDLSPAQTNFLIRLNRNGQLTGQIAFGAQQLLGLAFNPLDGHVYFALPGASKVQRVPASFGPNTPIEDVALLPVLLPSPAGPRVGPPTPNGLLFRASDGALLVSDQAQGAVFLIPDPTLSSNVCPTSSACVQTLVDNPLLASPGSLSRIGANGLALSPDEKRLFVSNTGENSVLVFDTVARSLRILSLGVFGPDGLGIAPNGSLIVSSFAGNEIVLLDPITGRPRAELGDFLGVDRNGEPIGVLNPANFIVVRNALLVTNLGPFPSILGSFSLAGEVTVPTLSRVRLR
jgi:DNA-binding beta-propeller fold protein YncE